VRTFFIIAGCAWFGLGLLFVLAIVRAATRRLPAPIPDEAFQPVTGEPPIRTLLAVNAAEEPEPVMDA
jgi:hypothetical protein